ncbi:hypothetical protein IAD21_00245 [Abditibacteriota bacterium]|nr:hypothetical protein IAD21_00245 [Abditibacteriota bacterium]
METRRLTSKFSHQRGIRDDGTFPRFDWLLNGGTQKQGGLRASSKSWQ